MQKWSQFAIIGILATTLILATSLGSMSIADAKKPNKPTKCNNIKILVKVKGVEVNSTYTANVQLGTGNKSKSGMADDNVSLTLPVAFKKVQPCPAIGFEYTGDVNGTDFSGKITSLKKPNKVVVDLS